MSYTTVPFPGAASPIISPGTPFQVAATPQPQQTIQPGSITYTTTAGPNGQIIYHPFKAMAASYQTPQGIVNGIQWVPAEATQVMPTGAVPASADIMASFNRGQMPPDGGAMSQWQREEERRRRKEERRERERDREDRELRRAREKDSRTGDRSRRGSFNAGSGYPTPGYSATNDLERRLQDLELDRVREREQYDAERRGSATGTRSRRGSFYGDRAPTGYQAAPGGPGYSASSAAYPSPAPSAGYPGSPATSYQYGRQSTYAPPSPRPGEAIARPVSPYSTGPAMRPVSPYQAPGAYPQRPVSPYQAGAYPQRPVSPYSNPVGVPRPVSPYSNPMGGPRPVSPYQPGIQRASSPRPGGDIYPRGHVMEGQQRRMGSRAPSPAPSAYGAAPPTSTYPGMAASGYGAQVAGYGAQGGGYGAQAGGYGAQAGGYGAQAGGYNTQTGGYGAQGGGYGTQSGGYGAPGMPPGSPRMPLLPGEAQQMLTAPEGFSRPPNLAQPYTHFEMMKIQDMDDFLEVIPRMPLVLVPHDVYHEDWIRFMNDLAMAWSGRLPVPEYSSDGRPPKRSTLVADLMDLWNASFFGRRGVEVVLYKGRERRSGRSIGSVDLHLPGFDTYDDTDDYDSSDDDSDDSSEDERDDRYRHGNAYGNVYSRQVESQMAELREAKRVRRERKAEKKHRKREKKRRAKLRELEKKYSLYLTCTSPREGGLGPQM